MPRPLHETATTTPRRADHGQVRLGRRDIDGLILCAEHYGAPYDLPAPRAAVLYRPRSGQSLEEIISGSDG